MLNKNPIAIATTSLVLLSVGAAWADDAAPAPAKPAGPTVTDVLTNSGITATGYVDASFAYGHDETDSKDYNTFALQQAALTLSYLPTTGFGALANVIVGENPYNGVGFSQLGASGTDFYLLQGYGQYVTGPLTLQAGKFTTLEGVEAVAPVLNTNVTRSILWNFEPVTHTGVRATYAVNDKFSVIFGVNNGVGNQEIANGSDKTFEAGLSFTPSKMLTWTVQGYYGRDYAANWSDGLDSAVKANLLLADTVLTWNATAQLSLVGSVDYGNVGSTALTPQASWYGFAGYLNYAINDQWRTSLRYEYFSDQDGYLTDAYTVAYREGSDTPTIAQYAQKMQEVTLTFGYDPIKNVEVRLEGRYDFPNTIQSTQYLPKTYQGWIEAYYKFGTM